MTIALLLFVAAAQSAGTVTYEDVPAAVERIRIFEWRDGQPPVETSAAIAATGTGVTIRAGPGVSVIAMFLRSDDAYLIDGPFRWPDGQRMRAIDRRWRRSVEIPVPVGMPADDRVEWVSAAGPGEVWPRCARHEAHAACRGVPLGESGVALVRAVDGIWWSIVHGTATEFQSGTWGRLLLVRGTSSGKTPGEVRGVRAVVRQAVQSRQRARSVRLETADVAGVKTAPVGSDAMWVSGGDVPDRAWVEVSAPRAGPRYLPLYELASGASSLPVQVVLEESPSIDGAVFSASGAPAAGALITLFRLLEPPGPIARERDPPPRVFVAEATADDRGAFRIDGLGDASYEVVAWHPQFGRASIAAGDPGRRIEIHLQSVGVIRGRVVSAGRPVEGVDVIAVPDPDAARSAGDLIDVTGGNAQTARDGRFVVSAVPGGGELRVGGGRHPVKRVPVARITGASLEVGDIELGGAIEISVVLNDDPECVVRAAGPVGRTGLQIVRGTRMAPGIHRLVIPEPGFWEFGLACAASERALTPGVMEIRPELAGKEVRFVVR